jgi:hypothetical protein
LTQSLNPGPQPNWLAALYPCAHVELISAGRHSVCRDALPCSSASGGQVDLEPVIGLESSRPVGHFAVVGPIGPSQRGEYRGCRRRGAKEKLLGTPPSVLSDFPAKLLATLVIHWPVNSTPDARHATCFGRRREGRIRQRHRVCELPLLDEQMLHSQTEI